MDISRKVADILLTIEAVKVSMDPFFSWTSGIKSPIYCDNRKIISHVIERELVVDCLVQAIREKEMMPDVIAGTATAAIPWAALVAAQMKLPMVYIRPEKKAHGAGRQIEGDLPEGQKVVIIEDLISTGGSSINSAQAIKAEGKCKVKDVLAIMTYGLDISEKSFEESKLKLTTLTDFNHITALALERGDIDESQFDDILKFKENPKVWAENL